MNSSVWNYRKLEPTHRKTLFYVLVGVLLITFISVAIGFTDNEIVLQKEHLEITGIYGEKILISEIRTLELTNKRPVLRRRINGFSMGNRKKGIFRTNDGNRVKVFINSHAKPWILITKNSGDKIYYSSSGVANQSIYRELSLALPNITKP